MDFYSKEQVYEIMSNLGIDVRGQTDTVWLGLCPFHGNTNTPAFAVNKTTGQYICFNDACGASGDMVSLVKAITKKTEFGAMMLINRAKANSPVNVPDIIENAVSDDPMPTYPQKNLDRMLAEYWKSSEAQEFMANRGFTEQTMTHYKIGYSPKQNMVAVPMYDINGQPVGIIGRSIKEKRFKNSKHLPKSRTLWNIHRAKRHPKLVICEASFDAMRVWQATGIEATAALGSSFSREQSAQMNKYFTHVVIFTDDDQNPTVLKNCARCRRNGHKKCVGHNTGLELGQKIAAEARGLTVTWAHLDSIKRFDGMKDAGDMTDEQINDAINKYAVPNVEMMLERSVV